MADKKITELTSYTSIQDSDVLPIVDVTSLATKKTTWSNIKSLLTTLFAAMFPDFSTAQTLTNKTLGAGTKIGVGSDAVGDIYYNAGSGTFTRLPIGTNGHILKVASGVPSWAAEATVSDGSYSAKGVLQGNTDAATSGLTIAGGVISVNSGTGANQIVKLNGSGQLPALNGALLTNVQASLPSLFVQLTKTTNATDGVNDNYLYVTTSDSSTTSVYGSFFVPDRTITSIQLLYGASNFSGQNQYWNFTFKSTNGATIETDSSTGTLLPDASGSSELLGTIPSSAYDGLTKGRVWSIFASREGGQGSDGAGTAKVMGILITYA
jgi:hypothetical protein